jgi:hypothetical protein
MAARAGAMNEEQQGLNIAITKSHLSEAVRKDNSSDY